MMRSVVIWFTFCVFAFYFPASRADDLPALPKIEAPDDLPQLEIPEGGFPKLGLPKPGAPDADRPPVAQPDPAKEGAVAAELAAQQAAARKQIAKKLGEAEEGHFILVFSNARPATIPARTKLPPGARRLPNNRWLEVLYQVEVAEGREAAVDLVMKFFDHVQRQPGAQYDWGLVARQADAAQAEQTLAAAQAKYAQASVTYSPRTPGGLRFFNHAD